MLITPADPETGEPGGVTAVEESYLVYIDPPIGGPGDEVQLVTALVGDSAGKVRFESLEAEVLAWSPGSVRVVVPPISADAGVVVETADGLQTNQVRFSYACKPACDGALCGPDGCGGECGTCTTGTCLAGVCCVADCADKDCGPDGCGGDCGTCAEGLCVDGLCCVADCADKACGSDGGGGECGACPAGQTCMDHACCAPACDDKACGSDGGGGSCGTCPAGESCVEGGCM